MTEFISNFMSNLFKDNAWLGVIFIAAVPIIELKGAIPFAMAKGLNIWQAFLFSYIGCLVPALCIVFLLKPIFNWMKKFKFSKKIAVFFEERFKRLAEKIKKKEKTDALETENLSKEEHIKRGEAHKRKTDRIKFWGVLVFVAIPLPGTGVWTGSAISVFLGMKARHALPAVLIGNFIAGIFISLVCVIFKSYLIVFYIILGVFLAAALVSLAVTLIKRAKAKNLE